MSHPLPWDSPSADIRADIERARVIVGSHLAETMTMDNALEALSTCQHTIACEMCGVTISYLERDEDARRDPGYVDRMLGRDVVAHLAERHGAVI